MGSLRTKLMLIFTVVLVAGVASVVWISTSLSLRDSKNSAFAALAELAKATSTQFQREVEQASLRARTLAVQTQDSAELLKLIQGDSGLAGLGVFDLQTGEIKPWAVQDDLNDYKISADQVRAAMNDPSQVGYSVQIRNTKSLHMISTPLVVDASQKVQKVLLTFMRPQVFESVFQLVGVYEKFLFKNDTGLVVLRSEANVSDGLRTVGNQMPQDLLNSIERSGSLTNNQVSLKTHETGATFIGHFYKLPLGEMSVALVSPESVIYETVYSVARRSAYLGLAILSLALVVAFLFADSIVRPLLFLVSAAQKISKGDFGVRTVPTTRDELATLTNAFNDMAAGLGERERLKEVFGKFHSKAVFAKLVKEDRLHLGGEKLAVTVFFSDIRSFTAIAEKMAPEAVVEMLNEYMSEMVAIIEKYDGVVDKYVGDAIMAVWGMPEPSPSVDAEKALRACLEMRAKLGELNDRRRARAHPPIEIGMGLNSGEVIAGNIGSPSRMEYTVIGDTVNTASRMESLTKDFKTDLLINESTLQLLAKPEIFLITQAQEASAKGKTGKILVYGCAGLNADQAAER